MCTYRISKGSTVSVSTKTSWSTLRLEKDLILDSKSIANTLPELSETVFLHKKSIYFVKNKDMTVL